MNEKEAQMDKTKEIVERQCPTCYEFAKIEIIVDGRRELWKCQLCGQTKEYIVK